MKFSLILLAALATTAPSTQPASPTIQALNQTDNPSAAVDVYVKGMAANPNDNELQQAYVHHMVDLDAPEMADAQAQDLVKRGAADPLTMGVAAYMDASRGQIPAAISNLKSAIVLQPADPFLLRTCAQVVCWYDTQSDRSMLTQEDVAGIETLRAAGKDRTEFDDAYRLAFSARQHQRDAQQQQPPAATTQATTDASQQQQQQPTYIQPPPAYYYDYGTQPYIVGGGNRYYYPYWDYGYWGGSSIIVLRDCEFQRGRYYNGWHRWNHDNNWNTRGGGTEGSFSRDSNGTSGSWRRSAAERDRASWLSSPRTSSLPTYDSPRAVSTPQADSPRAVSNSPARSSASSAGGAKPQQQSKSKASSSPPPRVDSPKAPQRQPPPRYDQPQPPKSSAPAKSSSSSNSGSSSSGSGRRR